MKNTIPVQYPESLARSLRLNVRDFELEMKISALVKLFELGKISSGIASKALGISRVEFLELLGKYQISVFNQYSFDDLEEDIKHA